MARIGIVGGGVSGLATAYFLQQAADRERLPLELTLLEATPHLGGVIRSERQQEFLLEWGPDAFVSYKPETFGLADRLALSDQLLPCREDRHRTFVSVDGQLRALPAGMSFLAPVKALDFWRTAPMTVAGRLRALLEPVIPRTRGEPTVRALFERRLGREFTARVAEPLVSAIFGDDIDRLAAPSALPDFWATEQRDGSFWRGLRRRARPSASRPLFFSFRNGMQELVSGLVRHLEPVNICRNTAVSALQRHSSGWEIRGPQLQERFEVLVLCVASHRAASLLSGDLSEVATLLAEIRYSSTRLVYLAYRRSEFSHPLNGFGFVLPKAEATALDACTWVSSKFEGRSPPDSVLLRCAVHDGRHRRESSTPEILAQAAHREVARRLGVQCQPTLQRVFEVPRAMPQFSLGHARRIESINSALKQRPGLHICSPFLTGVGIPDCIGAAQRTADSIVNGLLRGSEKQEEQ